MPKHEYNDKITIITADNGKYLMLKNVQFDMDLTLLGKPTQIIFDNSGIVPEFEEREVNE